MINDYIEKYTIFKNIQKISLIHNIKYKNIKYYTIGLIKYNSIYNVIYFNDENYKQKFILNDNKFFILTIHNNSNLEYKYTKVIYNNKIKIYYILTTNNTKFKNKDNKTYINWPTFTKIFKYPISYNIDYKNNYIYYKKYIDYLNIYNYKRYSFNFRNYFIFG